MPGKYTEAVNQIECTMCVPGKHGNWNPYYIGGYTRLPEKPWTANPNCIDCTYDVETPPDGTGIFADEVVMDGQLPIGDEDWKIENFKLPLWETKYNVYGNPKDGVEFDAVEDGEVGDRRGRVFRVERGRKRDG